MPDEFRAALLAPLADDGTHLADSIAAAELVGGLAAVGAGLYQHTHPCRPNERWFATSATTAAVAQAAQGCVEGCDGGRVAIEISPDDALRCCVVRVAAPPESLLLLDRVAFQLYASCLAEEVCDVTRARPGTNALHCSHVSDPSSGQASSTDQHAATPRLTG